MQIQKNGFLIDYTDILKCKGLICPSLCQAPKSKSGKRCSGSYWMIILFWLTILSCRLLSLLLSSSAFTSSPSLSYAVSFSFCLWFSSFTTLCFLSLSIPLLFSVFPLAHQLLTAFLSLPLLAFPVCHLSLTFLFLPPVHFSAFFSHSFSLCKVGEVIPHGERCVRW